MESPTFAKISSMHFYAWQKGLKNGMYYLRSKAATDPIKFTLGQKHQQKFVAAPSNVEGLDTNRSTMNLTNSHPTVSATIPAVERSASPAPIQMSALEMDQVQGKVCSIDNPDCESCSA